MKFNEVMHLSFYTDKMAVSYTHLDVYKRQAVANAVVSGEVDKGIVICGTGVGISLAANKVNGIRCVTCSEPYSARSVSYTHLADYHCTKAQQVNNLLYGKYGFRIQENTVKIVNIFAIAVTIIGLFALFMYEA